MKEIIESIHAQWLLAKRGYQERCEAAHFTEAAEKIAACRMFKGTESVAELAAIFTSPQGIEFCTENNFPNLATLRLFRKEDTERYGIFIDAGNIQITNPETAVLIGRTNATVHCDDLKRHTVVTMHGACATILASKWAVARCIAAPGTSMIRRTKDNAIIL